jgi:hypothetical protein
MPPVIPAPTKPPACNALPKSRINAHRTRASRHGLTLGGSAGEALCANASAATHQRQQIIRVYVFVYELSGRRCRFLMSSGHLSAPRSCSNPMRLAARGTTSWTLHLGAKLAQGHYRARSDAVDGFHHHQRPSGASFTSFTIR